MKTRTRRRSTMTVTLHMMISIHTLSFGSVYDGDRQSSNSYSTENTSRTKQSFCRKRRLSPQGHALVIFPVTSHFLHSPIFRAITAYVSRALRCHSSHLHFPLSPVPTSGMLRRAGSRSDVRSCRADCSGGINFSCRSEDSRRPRLQVRFSCWPEIKSVSGEEMTGERKGRKAEQRNKNMHYNEYEMH